MKQSNTTKKDGSRQDIIVNTLKSLLHENVISIVLFGSRVNHDKPYSDFDLLVVVSNLSKDIKKRDELLVKILSKFSFPVDLALLTLEELDNAAMNLSPLVLSMQENYKILYGEDIIAYEMNKLKKFFSIRKISKLGWRVQEVPVE
jgi:predicted nucleotidyltransferase